jgi:mRNA interferase MazF
MVKNEPVRRGDVFLASLGHAQGAEIQKTRPCVVVSPDELNSNLRTFIVAPLAAGGYPYPYRAPCRFKVREGYAAIDQIRTVDRERLTRRLGKLSPPVLQRVLSILQEMFAP